MSTRKTIQKSNKVSLWQYDRGRERSWLYLDFFLQGKRQREPLQLFVYARPKNAAQREHNREVKAQAEETRTKRQLAIQANEYDLDAKFKQQADFVEFFEGLAAKRHKTWHSTLIHLKGFAGGPVALREIEERWIEDFTEYLLEHVCKNTARTYLAKIKAAMNLAVRYKLVRETPFKFVPPLKVPDSEIKRVYLSEESLHKLADTSCPDAETKRAFLFACFVGLRLSDVLRLTWKDINLPERELRIIQQKTKAFVNVPLHETAISLLGAPKASNATVFAPQLAANGNDWPIWKALKAWKERAGIAEDISFHSSRRTFGTRNITAGNDIYAVKELLGQAELRSTALYLNLVQIAKRGAIDKLPGLVFKPELGTNAETETIKAEGKSNR